MSWRHLSAHSFWLIPAVKSEAACRRSSNCWMLTLKKARRELTKITKVIRSQHLGVGQSAQQKQPRPRTLMTGRRRFKNTTQKLIGKG